MTALDARPHAAPHDELEPVVSSLAAAFAEDPVLGWLLPDLHRRPQALARFFTLEIHHLVKPVGTIWTTDPHAGACLELPHAHWRMPLRAQARHAPGFVRVFGRRLGHVFGLISLMEHATRRNRTSTSPISASHPTTRATDTAANSCNRRWRAPTSTLSLNP